MWNEKMKWKTVFKKKDADEIFILFPTRCELCNHTFWLEWMYFPKSIMLGLVTMECKKCHLFKELGGFK